MKRHLVFSFGLFSMIVPLVKNTCPRDGSRVVREVLNKKLFPIYDAASVAMPYRCPFSKDRDLYINQEQHKRMVSWNNWNCNFCGKSFYAEKYLDKHFANRHAEHIRQGNDSVCLSDFCDVFRCEILGGVIMPDYWDMALCLEDDMQDLQRNCKNIIKQCIPNSVSKNTSDYIQEKFSDDVCSFLNCKKYWQAPFPEAFAVGTAVYVISSVMLLFVLILYYCIAYHYFYTDSFIDYTPYEYTCNERKMRNPATHDVGIRYRHTHVRRSR